MDVNILNKLKMSGSLDRYFGGRLDCYECGEGNSNNIFLLKHKKSEKYYPVVRCKKCKDDFINNKAYDFVEDLNNQDIFTLKILL